MAVQMEVINKKSGGESGSDGGDSDKFKGCPLENGNLKNNHIGKGGVPSVASANGKENGASNTGAFDVNKLQKLRSKGVKKTETVANKVPKEEPKKKITKKNRVWDDSPKESKLDFTDPVSENGEQNISAVVVAEEGESMMDKEEIISSDSDSETEEETVKDNKADTKKKGWFSSMFQRLLWKMPLFAF